MHREPKKNDIAGCEGVGQIYCDWDFKLLTRTNVKKLLQLRENPCEEFTTWVLVNKSKSPNRIKLCQTQARLKSSRMDKLHVTVKRVSEASIAVRCAKLALWSAEDELSKAERARDVQVMCDTLVVIALNHVSGMKGSKPMRVGFATNIGQYDVAPLTTRLEELGFCIKNHGIMTLPLVAHWRACFKGITKGNYESDDESEEDDKPVEEDLGRIYIDISRAGDDSGDADNKDQVVDSGEPNVIIE